MISCKPALRTDLTDLMSFVHCGIFPVGARHAKPKRKRSGHSEQVSRLKSEPLVRKDVQRSRAIHLRKRRACKRYTADSSDSATETEMQPLFRSCLDDWEKIECDVPTAASSGVLQRSYYTDFTGWLQRILWGERP